MGSLKSGIPSFDRQLGELLDPLGDGPRRFLAFLFFNVLSWQALIGTVLVLHARALGIDAARVGLLNSIMFFTSVLGLATKPLAERIGSRRLLMGGWTLRNIVVAPIVLTPWVHARWGADGAMLLLGSATLLFCATRALAGIAWSSWQHEIVPPAHLARYYTLETMLTRLLTAAFGLLAFFTLGHHPPPWRFSAIAAGGVVAGLLSVRVLARVPGGGPPPGDGTPRPWHHGFGALLRDRPFLRLMGCLAVAAFAQAALGLFLPLLLRDRLSLGPGPILFVTTLGSCLTLITSPRWRRVADALGSPITLTATLLLLALCFLGLAPLGVWRLPLLYLLPLCLLLPMAEAGLYVASARALMLHMDARHRHAYNAVWGAAMALCGGSASLLSGWLLRRNAGGAYALLALGGGVLLLLAAYLASRLREGDIVRRAIRRGLFAPRRPWHSLLRIWGYVFWRLTVFANGLN